MTVIAKWAGVGVAVQSALDAAKTITAISKANPGVVTSTAHGYVNGDFVVLTIQGMYQVDGRVFRVANVAANTFELEGENTTTYDTFASGTAERITFGTTLSTLVSLNASGGDFDFIETTTIHDLVKKQVPGNANAAVYSFESIWDVSDAGLIALKGASDSQAKRAVRFTIGAQKMVFNGYIGASLLPTGSAGELVKTNVSITGTGQPKVYAT